MVKIASIFSILIFAAVCPAMALQADRTITGKVVDIDSLGSRLSVRVVNYRGSRPDQFTFQVPKDAVLTCGTRDMSFLNINVSDMVTVTYYSDDLGGLKVRSLSDLNMGNR